ncbi:MAG TPA: cupin domain-containing protein [Chloroflexota bacterium]|nr:cupin domain-containing protein [Chloroflexota bacterium]
MATFYDEWLAAGPQIDEAFRRSPMIAHDRDIPWVRTRQDARVKLMLSNTLGFPTMGGCVVKAEIPVGWHTGKRSHGEEAVYLLQGEGFSVVDGQRLDWHTGTTLQIPYRAVHQHFNTGATPALYLSATCSELERFVHLARLEQLEDCGPNDPAVLATVPPETSQLWQRDGRRLALHLEDAPCNIGETGANKLEANENQHDQSWYLADPRNGFQFTSVGITHIFEEPPYHHSGRHKHLEAVIYVLSGEGYSDVRGEAQHWEAGDVLHVPPAMFEHEHYNDSPYPLRYMRIQFGIRYWFTGIWPEGYTSRRIYDEHGKPIIAGHIERVRERE